MSERCQTPNRLIKFDHSVRNDVKHSETVCAYMYVYMCTQKARHNKKSTLWFVLIRKGKGVKGLGGGGGGKGQLFTCLSNPLLNLPMLKNEICLQTLSGGTSY